MRVVAEGVVPPAGDEVETASAHGFEEVVPAICSSSQLGGFFLSGLGVGSVVRGWGCDVGD